MSAEELTQTAKAPKKKARQLFREGMVLKDKMDKTVIVEVTRLMQHPTFKKVIRSKVRYAVHDEKNEAKVGDKVRISRTKPMSKTKRWRMVQVLKK